ncbi:hypothetical protein D3C75_1034170 [compost metagenome]
MRVAYGKFRIQRDACFLGDNFADIILHIIPVRIRVFREEGKCQRTQIFVFRRSLCGCTGIAFTRSFSRSGILRRILGIV